MPYYAIYATAPCHYAMLRYAAADDAIFLLRVSPAPPDVMPPDVLR